MGNGVRERRAARDAGGKKRLTLQLLELLREGAGGEREFSQKCLAELLAERYGTDADRDTVKANLELLREFFPEVRSESRGKFVMWSWREPEPEPLFDASQARWLADGIVAARRMTPANKAELLGLVLGNADAERMPWDDVLASTSMESRGRSAVNPDFFLSVEVLAECIQNGRRAAFRFGEVDRSGKFVKAPPEEGEVGPVVPLFLIVSGGNYYLALRFPGHEKTYHYRVDLMHDVREVATPEGAPGPAPLNAGRYRGEHPLMFSGAGKVTVRIKDTSAARLHFFDHFGGGRVSLLSQEGGHLTYEVHADQKAAVILACQFAGEMEIIAPQEARDAVAAAAKTLTDRYSRDSDAKAGE